MIEKNNKKNNHFTEISKKLLHNIKKEDIIYCESYSHKIILHTVNKDIYMYAKLNDIEGYLSSNIFLRIHKSYLINQNYIQGLSKNVITLSNGIRLNISRSTSKEIYEKCLLAVLKKKYES
ncbi:LytR/AlgR family response regulator transcription factor [Lachnobacterium bovis]|uniref:LytTr DNA-binding domain-containing protein n=1 Tax=Lachnobacterium bovis TaxID=140626 RepID=A0A1H9UJB0_9FIRM|nr:LytTR family DNA-binding domain-containing protein [Lachnobacterium bovis]SES09123.1 LytTr DNA-binding domain-containing protein [Lachnobacterium bovis]